MKTIMIPSREEKDNYHVMFVQGKRIEIKKDEYVQVPDIYAEIQEECNMLSKKGTKREILELDGR